jgi:hypothetical protein
MLLFVVHVNRKLYLMSVNLSELGTIKIIVIDAYVFRCENICLLYCLTESGCL